MIDYYVVYKLFEQVRVSWIFFSEDYFHALVNTAIPRDGGKIFTTGSVDDRMYDRVRPVIEDEVRRANQNGMIIDVDGLQQKIAEAIGSAQH